MADSLKLGLLITTEGIGRSVGELLAMKRAIEDTANQSEGITQLARSLGTNFKEAQKLSTSLGLTGEKTAQAVGLLRELSEVGADNATKFAVLTSRLGLSADQIERLSRVASQADNSGGLLSVGGIGKLVQGAGQLYLAYQGVLTAIQGLAASGKQAYDLLIGSNEKLNQQVLKSQANLAATTKISQGGVEITDPTEKVTATAGKLREAIKQIAVESQDLVGVTSEDVNQTFQTVLQNVSSLAGQSKKFTDPIEAAVPLTKSLVASLGVLNIPLDQASQEIRSIVSGQITSDSLLAKSLGINNQMVAEWRSQGILVDKLNETLLPFVEANGMAANSISGITSNLQDVFEILLRQAGEPLLEPVVAQLRSLYDFINANKDAIQAGITSAIQVILNIANVVGSTLQKIGQILAPIVVTLGEAFADDLSAKTAAFTDTLEILAQVAVLAVQALTPLLQIVAQVAAVLADLLNSELGRIALTAALTTLAFGQLGQAALALTPVITTLAARFVAMRGAIAAVGIQGLAAQFLAAIPAMQAFAASAAAALGPFIALGGAIVLTLIIKKTQDLKNAQEEIDTYSGSTDRLSQESLKLAGSLKTLNDAEKNSGKLTEEQAAKRRQLIKISQDQIKANSSQITSLKELAAATSDPSQKAAIEGQIAVLERMNQALAKQQGGLTLSKKGATSLGDDFKQLKDRVDQARTALENSANNDEATDNAKKLQEAIALQLEMGQITQEEARKELEAIASNNFVRVEGRKAARDAIAKIEEEGVQGRVEAIKAERTKIDQQLAQGTISQAEAERQKTENTIREAQARLEANRAALADEEAAGRGGGERARGLRQKIQQDQSAIAQAEAEGAKRLREQRLKDFDEQQSELEGQLARGLVTRQDFATKSRDIGLARADEELAQLQEALGKLSASDTEGREEINAKIAQVYKRRADILTEFYRREVELIEEAQRKNADAVKLAETQQEKRIQDLLNSGVLNQEEADKQRLNLTQDRLKKELAANDQAIQKLKALPALGDPKAEEDRQAKIRSAVQQSADLQLQLSKNVGQQQEALRAAAIKKIKDQEQAEKLAGDRQVLSLNQVKAAQEAVNRVIESRKQLLESQNNLERSLEKSREAQSSGELQRINKAIDLRKQLAETEDPEKRKVLEQAIAQLTGDARLTETQLADRRLQIEQKIAQQKLASLAAEQVRVRQLQELDNARNIAAAKNAVIQAQIAELQAAQAESAARTAVATAAQTVDKTDDDAAAQQLAEAQANRAQAGQTVQAAQQNVVDEQTRAAQVAASLAAQQEAERATAATNEEIRQIDQGLAVADLRAQGFASNLQLAAQSAAQIKASLDALSGTGGAIAPPSIRPPAFTAPQSAQFLNPSTVGISGAPASATAGDNGALVREIQGLRADMGKAPRPQQNNSFTLVNEVDPTAKVVEISQQMATAQAVAGGK